MNSLFSIKEKVILLTGGYGILGACMAKHLAREGAYVVILGRNEQKGSALVNEIKAEGGEALFLVSNVLDKALLEQNKQEILKAYGKIDVLVNLAGGNWYAVGGKSFLAQLFKDAGADYFLKDDERSGGVTLDFETVYNQADDADFWRIVNSFPGTFSYEALKEQDPRYADFRAFREKGIIYCNMKNTPFYESMPTEPEIVLADLLHIFHPDLLPDHEPVYYSRLK